MKIRDFIYLDTERVRSFYSQLSEGLPTEQTTGIEHEVDASASVEGNFLFAKGKGGTDARYMRANTETRSLHDYLMELFINKLEEKRLLPRIPSENFDWVDDAFSDGQFVLVQGAIKIIDYKYFATSLGNIPSLYATIQKLASYSPNKNTTKPTNLSTVKADIDKMPIKDLNKFIEQNLLDSIKIRVYPYIHSLNQNFIAIANQQLFRQNPVSLINIYGHIIDANWYCLLQINKGNQHSVANLESDLFPLDIESAMENIFDQITNIGKLIQGVKFPSVGATPIAIFREI